MKVDYLIVGRGIAGTVLSYLLWQRNKKFVLIDRPDLSSASSVSAGICNPVVFRKITTSWMVEQLLPKATEVYEGLENLLQHSFISRKETLKVFSSPEEKAWWKKKAFDPGLMEFISPEEVMLPAAIFHAPWGAGKVMRGMQVDLMELLPRYREFLKANDRLRETVFDHDLLSVSATGVEWEDVQADHLIFCEGYHVLKNPWFHWLPLKPVKGEALIITADTGPLNYLVNRKLIFCPLAGDRFWAGGTYEWKQLDEIPTAEARSEIIGKLEQLLRIPFRIIDQKAGVRPAVRDRRPLIGTHPEQHRLHVFNGLGTKGTMIAPYFAGQLIDKIEAGVPLNGEVDIQRFYRFYEAGTNGSG